VPSDVLTHCFFHRCQNTTLLYCDFVFSRPGTIPVCYRTYITYRYGVWPTNQKITVYGSSIWRFTCGNSNVHVSLGTKWIFPDTESADTRGHFGIYLEWVKETSMYIILCECTMAYTGETGCSIKSSTTDSSILSKSAIAEHGINILPMDKGVLARKYSHINYITWDVIVIRCLLPEQVVHTFNLECRRVYRVCVGILVISQNLEFCIHGLQNYCFLSLHF